MQGHLLYFVNPSNEIEMSCALLNKTFMTRSNKRTYESYAIRYYIQALHW